MVPHVRFALSRTSDSRWPIWFQSTCERTVCNPQGKSETLKNVIERLDKGGYDLIHSYEDLIDILKSRGREE